MSIAGGSGSQLVDDIDRVVHEPARLVLMAHLHIVDEADFVYLADRTGFTAGNISSHMTRLQRAGYVTIHKTLVDRRPRTTYALTQQGRTAFERYRDRVEGLLAATRP